MKGGGGGQWVDGNDWRQRLPATTGNDWSDEEEQRDAAGGGGGAAAAANNVILVGNQLEAEVEVEVQDEDEDEERMHTETRKVRAHRDARAARWLRGAARLPSTASMANASASTRRAVALAFSSPICATSSGDEGRR